MTRSLTEGRPEIAAKVRVAGRVWIGVDFDGTLAHHHDDPRAVELPTETRQVLTTLAQHPAAALAVVTGRALPDIKRRIALPSIAYAGNHGLEIEARGLTERDPVAVAARPLLDAVLVRLQQLGTLAGVYLQDKGLTLAVDFRGTPIATRRMITDTIDRAAQAVGGLVVRHAALGSELRPQGAGHKGTAAVRLWHYQTGSAAVPIYLGDTSTDEDAFETLAGAVTVKVGEGSTQAAYRARDPDEVRDFLHWLTAILG